MNPPLHAGRPVTGKRLLSTPRITTAAALAVTLVLGLGHAPAMAYEPTPYKPQAGKPVPKVPVEAATITPAPKTKDLPPASARPVPTWPKAAAEIINVPAPGSQPKQADVMPVRIEQSVKAAAARSAKPAPSRVQVEMLDRKATERAGVRGVLMRLGRADGITETGTTKVTLDYKTFETAYGADWASRLRLVTLPACALTTPQKSGCESTPLATDNDTTARTLSAEVPVASASTLVAATAAASGPAGSYAATTLNASSTWNAGGNSGDFTWSYPMTVPPPLGGPAPQVQLSYSAQSVDGRHAASNNQPSRVGEGFEEPAGGFIERRYVPCSEDMSATSNNKAKTGDLCWETDNATISLAGHSGELIYNATEKRWHLRGDDGSRIVRNPVTPTNLKAVNGDNDGEYWVLTTSDGTQYWFGINRLPGWTTGKALTNSVLTVPVFGNDAGEPCYATAFIDSDCVQAWRWNLDYVVDPLGNSMSYWYDKFTNKYSRNLDNADAAPYDREAVLARIDYGTRRSGGIDSAHKTSAPMRVDFTYADRCLSTCDTHDATRWPDVPWDSECTSATCEDKYSPTFWSTKRLATVTTQVKEGTAYSNVDRWTLTHTFPDPGDGTRAGLWLSKLSRTGLGGGSIATPDVEFTPVQKANRVDVTGDFAAAMNWMRIARIRTETGGSIGVAYSEQDCKAGAMPNPATNTSLCYPVRWVPEGYAEPVTDWFNKYVVTTIYESDNTGGVPPMGSPRKAYTYTYLDGAAWHYADDDGMTKKKYKTWSHYRGFGKVGVTVGDPGESTYTETRYFRGMNGDRLNTTGGSKAVAVDGIADEEWFAGQTRENITYANGPGSTVLSRTRYTPWASAPTATRTINGETVTSRFTGVAATTNHVTLDNGRAERVTKSVNTYDDYGMVTQIDDLGQDGVDGDEKCVQTDYTPRNTTSWILSRTHSVKSYAVKCAATTGTLTEAQIIGEIRTSFDKQAYKATPTQGIPTQTQEISAWSNGTPTFVTTSQTAYDVHGRPTSVTDVRGFATTTTYTPASDGPLTATQTKNHLQHTSTATINPATGALTGTVDVNGKRTDTEYDALGRLTAVWHPGRTKGTDTPSVKYGYAINTAAPSVVSTSALNAAGSYITSYTLYDGLLRPRQTQSPSPSGGRIITEAFYDTAGRQILEYGAYHSDGTPGATLLTSSDQAFVPTQTRTVYDGAGRPVASVFQPYGKERWRTTTAYAGDRTDVTPPTGGTATSTVTDARGNTIELRQYHGTTPTPHAANTWVSTEYKYDPRGYQTKLVDHLDNTWTTTYDIRGRQTAVDDPDRGITKYTHDNAGNILTATDARGKTIAYTYDALGRKTNAYDNQVGGVLRAQWIYDTVAKGQLSTSTRFMGSVGYQTRILDYNDRYQPGNTQIVIPSTETGLDGIYNYNITYNIDGSVKSTSIPSTNTGLQPETLTYAYDSFGQPTTVNSLYGSTNQAYVTGTDYNALGQLDQVKLYTGTGAGGRVYTKYTRELETGRLTGIRTDRDSVAPYILADTTYQYDNAANITKIVDAAPAGVDDTQCFTHDYLARLTEAWTPANGDCTTKPATAALGGPAPYWHNWTIDVLGNRTEETVHTTAGETRTTNYHYPSQGSATKPIHGVTSTTGVRTGAYTYDAAGNTLTRPTETAGTQTLTWDPEGHLNTATDSTGTTTYIYDADGNRLIQRDPTGRTLYLPGQEIRYTNSTATTSCTRYYGHVGATIGSRNSTGLTWLSPDHQGTAGIAINAATQQATTRRQTPYGTPRGVTPEMWPNNRGYLGGTKDNTGLTHLAAREYDPTNGRFISVDPLQDLADPQQWNGYAYTENNPVTYSDPSGLGKTKEDLEGMPPRVHVPIGTPSNTGGPVSGGGGNGSSPGDNSGRGGHDPGNTPVDLPENLRGFLKTDPGYKHEVYTIATVTEWLNASGANQEVYCHHVAPMDPLACQMDMHPSGPVTVDEIVDLGKELSGYTDLRNCTSGENYGACAWFAVGLLPLGKARAAAKALRLGDEAAEGVQACLRANSFSGDTEVLLADGTTKQFKDLRKGDEVLATDPETGEEGPRRVDAVWVHEDDLYAITIGGQQLETTEDHPFWNETDRQWQDAQILDRGDLVSTPTGTAQVDGFEMASHKRALAYNLTVAGIHTYYVLAGTTPVLVHNLGGGGPASPSKGAAGTQMLIEDLSKRGYVIRGTEISMTAANGVNVRFDVVAEKNGVISVYDAKNGPSAGFTKNQGTLGGYESVETHGGTFYGPNAQKAGLAGRVLGPSRVNIAGFGGYPHC